MRDMSGERGAVLVLAAVFVSVLLGIAALVVDHGHNLNEYRRLTTATDAAALAAASVYGAGADGCATVSVDYVVRNSPEAAVTQCQVFGGDTNGTLGWVVVTASRDVDQFFAKTVGFDVVTVRSESTALFGMPTVAHNRVRPMGLCLTGLETNPAYQTWQSGSQNQRSSAIRVLYNKAHGSTCGSTTGNWGFIDFDGAGNSNSDTKKWIEFGYPIPIGPDTYEGDPGALSGSHKAPLQALVDSAEVFWLPVFDTSSGNGGNVEYRVTNFLPVQLVDFKTNGKQARRYLEFHVVPNTLSPETACCAPAGTPDTGRRMTALVALDHNGQPIGVSS